MKAGIIKLRAENRKVKVWINDGKRRKRTEVRFVH